MTACEQCWTDAYLIARMTGRHQAEVYQDLVAMRTHKGDEGAEVSEPNQHSADECCVYCTSQGEQPSVTVADIELCPYQTAWAYDGLGRDGDHLT